MELAVKAAGWVVGKALAPVTDGLLEAWAASNGLGPNVDALKMELLYAQAMLTNAHGREIHNPALKEMLNKLRQLAYNADDVLDELEYFRIQDELDGTNHAADAHAEGCVKSLFLNARHTARDVVAKLKLSSGSRDHPQHDEQVNNAKQGCFSTSMCSCGGRTLSSSTPPPSPTNRDGNGRRFFCASLPSKVQGCLCSKRERSSASPAPTTNQCDKKVDSGCLPKVTSTACNTVKSFGKCLPCCSFQSVDGNAHTGMSENPNMPLNGNRFLSCAWRSKVQQRDENTTHAPKLKFRRVDISEKMEDIIKHLKPLCAKVSDILNLEFMGTTRTTTKDDIAKKRPITTEYIAEDNKLYGRDVQKKRIVDGITLTHGEYFADELVVLPIVGPGGIGKTTFTRHVYDEVQSHFHVALWICVSLNFNASRLAQEAVKKIPKVDGEKENSSDAERIEQRLKTKRFLLVLDDMWEYHEHEWEKLLAPFRRGGEKGNMVIVTTRSPKVAEMVLQKVDHPVNMSHLEDKDFMHLFEACVFVDQNPWEGDTKNLHDVGKEIVRKLKGFPLAAKTVGRLLRNQLTSKHWTRVLKSKEWELQTNEDDIMPALKLSYDYLPFHLQQCFYYCALFPEDYEFESKELVHFWIGLDIVHPSDLNRRIKDVGLEYLDDLVNHGFFKKNQRNGGCPVYVIHDLLHDLAVKISSFECLCINSSNVKSVQIPQDVRHLSIIVDKKDVEDIKTFKYYKTDLAALDKRLKVENLRTLMVFGEHHGSFVKTFCDLFERAGALRVIYLSGASYTVEDMLCNFSKLIHLRYLRIESADTTDMTNTDLLSALSIFYHLEVIDVQKWENCSGFTRHMSNLAKLRYFLVPKHKLELHSNIVEVGKLRLLQELKRFEVGKESKGFELNQLGDLSELGGSLAIHGLERLQAIEEASEARLVQIKCLRTLTLQWDASVHQKHSTCEEDALEILIPHSNLQGLWIRDHGGTKCPQWLGESLSVKNLESLLLDGVAWKTFPPIGELWLVNEGIPGNIPDTRFQKLKRLELMKLPGLLKWVGHTPCQLFAHLEVLTIRDCSELTELSFSHSTCCKQEKEANMSWSPKLQEVDIAGCPKLLSFPPVPWKSALCSARIRGVGLGFESLVCGDKYRSEFSLKIEGKDVVDSTVWNLLAFDNLTELKELEMDGCPPLPLQHHFQMLSCLKTLTLRNSSSIVNPLVEGEGRAEYQFPVECMIIDNEWGASVKELTHLLTYFRELSELIVLDCKKITGLGVMEKQDTASPSADKVDVAQIEHRQHQDVTRGEEEIAAETEGLLLLPSQLQKLWICDCPELILRSASVDDNREAGRTWGGQGLQGLTSLRSLKISDCPRFLSSYSPPSSSPCFPFPTSLEYLYLGDVETLPPLSKLTSLSDLSIRDCGELKGEGLWPLLTHGRLTKLTVHGTPNFFAGSEPSPPELPSSSSKLLQLETNDVAGVLAEPICAFLSSSLTGLTFSWVKEVERFTKEQEEALQLLTSLESIRFLICDKLQCLPAGLHRLPNLKRLDILYCAAIRSLPKDGLPNSLQELEINSCSGIRSIHKECLPNSLQKLVIRRCPAIRLLPKVDDLPSSLLELDACNGNSEELRKQCRKFLGTIPIVYA